VFGDHSSETWVAAEELIMLRNRKVKVKKVYRKIKEKMRGYLLNFLAILDIFSLSIG